MKASENIQKLLDEADDVGHEDAWDVGWRVGVRQALARAKNAEEGLSQEDLER